MGSSYTPLTTQFLPATAATVVTRDQMRQALLSQGVIETVDEATPAANNSAAAAYMNGPLLSSIGPAAAFIQSTLSYTVPQMNALFALAATFTY
jgi:hypothetical protein